jgi:LmbE family N-acetylglucosaminyl deacetylase
LNFPAFNTVLVLSPHTDDGELGAGGTISRLAEEGSELYYIAFCSPLKTLESECIQATKVLGITWTRILDFDRRHFPAQRQEILQTLYDLNLELKPNLILTPCTADHHQDHETVTNEAIRIFKKSTILGYILPWNTLDTFENCIIKLEKRHLNEKLKALRLYSSQQRHMYFNPQYLKSNIIGQGVKIDTEYAEVFEVIRFVL